MTNLVMRRSICLASMLFLFIGSVFSQSVVNLGSGLYSTKFYESMNASNPPAGDWFAVDYDDISWGEYNDPIDFPEYDAFWVRRSFYILDDPNNHSFRIQLAHDDEASIYINGNLVHNCGGCGRYNYYDVPISYLVEGLNVLAAYVRDTGGERYLECFISTTDGSDIIADYPSEPRFTLSSQAFSLYCSVNGYSGKNLSAKMMTPSGQVNTQVSWSSSDPAVASVNNGRVEALTAGNSIITATTEYNGLTYSVECPVQVYVIDQDAKVVIVDEPGQLGSLLTDDEKDNVEKLVVFGRLDGRDIQVLRYMTGRNERGNRSPGLLAELDIKNVEFVNNDHNYFRISNEQTCYYYNNSELPERMFYNCAVLNTIALPGSIRTIGNEAFRECSNLENIEIPHNVSVIRGYAFANCTNLRVFEIPNTVRSIGYEIFGGCSKLESAFFQENCRLTEIPSWAFSGTKLRSVTIPSSIISINDYAFYYCNYLQDVLFEDGSELVEIKNNAFSSCNNLQRLYLPDGCMDIGNESFSNCNKLISINIPVSLTSIGNGGFRECYSLVEVNIPEKSRLVSIGTNAFSNTNLESFYIPKGLSSISDVFEGSTSLKSISVHPDNRYYEEVGGILYSKRDQSVVMVPKSVEGVLSFPDYVINIPDNLLKDCSGLKGVVLHSGITDLGDNVFSGCSGLKTLMALNSTPISVSEGSFNGVNKGLVTLVVPQGSVDAYRAAAVWNSFDNIIEVSEQPIVLLSADDVVVYDVNNATARTSTVAVTVITKDGISTVPVLWTSSDANVATVTDGVIEYAGEGTATITASVTVGEYTVSSSCTVTSVGVSEGKMVYVENAGTLSTLLTDSEKNDLTHLIVMGNINNDDIRVLRYMAGRDEYGNLTVGSLEVLDMNKTRIVSGGENGYYNRDNWWRSVSENYLNSDIFRECYSLKKVILPSSLKNLGSYAFYGCKNLEEVVLPSGLTNIEYDAFGECRKLSSISIPSSVTSISSRAFYGCTSLKSIDLSTMTGVSTIPDEMFCESGLTSIKIPAHITKIDNYAFQNTPLKSVEFERGSQLATIGDRAFQSTQLQSITIPSSVTSINNYAFYECRKLTNVSYANNNNLTSIGEGIFGACPIDTFLIPKRLISMGRQDFDVNQTQIIIEEGNKFFELIDGILYSKADNAVLYVPKEKSVVYLPDYVTSLKSDVLKYHQNLKTVVLTSSMSDLGESPFYDDYNLTEIYCMSPVPPSVRYLTNGWSGKIYIPVGSKEDYEDAGWESSLLVERSYSKSIVVSSSELTLYGANGGNSSVLTSKVFSENGPVQHSNVSWISSNNNVVTVDTLGHVRYAGPGTATITASTTLDGSEYTAECAVTSIEVADPANAYYLTGKGNDLRSMIGEDNKYNIEKLVLVGKMSDDDRSFIREMSCERWDGSRYVTGALKYLDMNELVDTIISDDAFENCRSLEKVILPKNIQLLGSEAFAYCYNLSSIIFPETVKELRWGALRSCNGLKSVEFLGMNAPRLSDYVFGEIGSSYCVVVPTGSKGYKTDENWNRMSNIYEKGSLPILVLDESVINLYNIVQAGVNERQLNAYAIMSDGMISTDLTWESSDPQIVKIDSTGFLRYIGVGNAVISVSVTDNGKTETVQCDVNSYSIDDAEHAYYLTGYGNLRSLIGEDNKYNIEKLVLVGKMSDDDRNFIREMSCNRWEGGREIMGALKYLDMSHLSDTIIGGFSDCKSLETVKLPEHISILENEAFAYCSKLTSLMFPESITELRWGALRSCNGIKSIQFLGVRAPQLSDFTFGEIESDYCVIVPANASGYSSNDYWKDMTNVYSTDMLPILVMDEKKVELYNTSQDGMNKHQLMAYAITVDGITSDVTWSSSDDSVASVSVDGLLISGSNEGQATVTATYSSLGKTVSSEILVNVVDIADFKFVNVVTAGTLSELLPEDELLDIKKLIVLGNLNGDDIRVLRRMAGRDENGNLTAGSLEVLNMYNAKIVNGGEGYYNRDGWWRNVSEDSFGENIFRECNSLKKVVLPSSLRYLGYYAFYACQNLEEVVLSEGLTNIEHQAFYNCRKLTTINIPSSVTYLSSWVFYGCNSLKTIDLSSMTGVNTLPEYLFYESGLTNIRIPAHITNINMYAFQNTPLKSVEFERGSQLATIGDGAFQSTQLQSITIPASVTSINSYAFYDCQRLKDVIYEDNNKLGTIGDNVFNGCPITSFVIPKRLISMGNQNFSESLSEIVVEEGNKFFETYDGVLCSKSEGSLIYVPQNKTSIFLPEYVTSINNGVLRDHYNLKTVVLSSKISDLGDQPFWADNSLKEVYCMNAVPPIVRNLSENWYCDRKIYIPMGSKEAYIEAEWDSTLLEERVFDYGITLSTGNLNLYNVNGGNERELSAIVFSPAGPSKSE